MATVFTDAAGYTHTLHSVTHDRAVIHCVWTVDRDHWYLGCRQLVQYRTGTDTVEEGWWVFSSDWALTPTKYLTPDHGARMLAAWRAAALADRTADTPAVAA